MNILFASGKGGAGKTTVSVSLANVWPRRALLVDADVEAPNSSLFARTQIKQTEPSGMRVPAKVNERCDLCGDCLTICQWKAIVKLGERITTFPDMCHGCGGCFAVCTRNAIVEGERPLGSINWGTAFDDRIPFIEGRSRIGESMTPPLLRALNRTAKSFQEADPKLDLLIDAPPGVSCPVMTASRIADAVVLVAEPTPFGLYDFLLALQAFEETRKPIAVILNRCGQSKTEAIEKELVELCQQKHVSLLGRLPFDMQAAQHYAQSQPLSELNEQWHQRFENLAQAILLWQASEVQHA